MTATQETTVKLPKEAYLTQTGVIERGWTLALVKRFLGAPDLTRPNSTYRSASPTKLFLCTRVEAAEGTPAFAAASASAARRSAASTKAAAVRRVALLKEIEDVVVRVPQIEATRLRSRAISHFNDRALDRAMDRGYDRGYENASHKSDGAFLDRITVN